MSSFAIPQPTWVGNEPYAPPSSRTRSKRKLAASPRTHYGNNRHALLAVYE